MIRALIVATPALWLAQAWWFSRVISRRGFNPLPWLAVGYFLGPAVWPLALIEALPKPPRPELVPYGRPRPDGFDVFAASMETSFRRPWQRS